MLANIAWFLFIQGCSLALFSCVFLNLLIHWFARSPVAPSKQVMAWHRQCKMDALLRRRPHPMGGVTFTCLPRWQTVTHVFGFSRAGLASSWTEHGQVCSLARLLTHSGFFVMFVCSFVHLLVRAFVRLLARLSAVYSCRLGCSFLCSLVPA